jgi:hypothetical protein
LASANSDSGTIKRYWKYGMQPVTAILYGLIMADYLAYFNCKKREHIYGRKQG